MDFSDKAHAMNPTGKGRSWGRLTFSAGASPRPLESRTFGNLVRKRVRLWGRGAFWASGLSPTSPFLSYPNPIRHRGQGPGSARTHRLRKEKAFPGTCGRRKAWFTIRHILRRLGYTGRRKRRKAFFRPTGLGRRNSPSPWPKWTSRTSATKPPWARVWFTTARRRICLAPRVDLLGGPHLPSVPGP